MCTLKNLSLWSRCSIVVPTSSYEMPLLRQRLKTSSVLAHFRKHLTALTLGTWNSTSLPSKSLQTILCSYRQLAKIQLFSIFICAFFQLWSSPLSCRETWLLLHDPSHFNCFSPPPHHHLHSVLSTEQTELLFFKQELLIWVPPFVPQLYPIACNAEGWLCQSYGGANMGEVLAGIISCVTIVTSPPTSPTSNSYPQTLLKPPSHWNAFDVDKGSKTTYIYMSTLPFPSTICLPGLPPSSSSFVQ